MSPLELLPTPELTPEQKKKAEADRAALDRMNDHDRNFYKKADDMNDIDLERFARGMAEMHRRQQELKRKPSASEPTFPKRGHLRIIK